jgi:hypothetical protein
MVTDPEVIRYLPPASPATMGTAQAAIESRHAMEAELGYAMRHQLHHFARRVATIH